MFLVSIAIGPCCSPEGVARMAHARFPLGGGSCDFYYDPSWYRLATPPGQVTLLRNHLTDGEVARLDVPSQALLLRKPLLLGLPVYHSSNTRSFVASTSVRLLRGAGVRLEEDREALPEFFVYRYVTPPRTLFANVSCLPVGGTLRTSVDGSKIVTGAATWTNAFRKTTTLYHLEESAARIKEDLEHSVQGLAPLREQLACLMSGGVDSSILYALCKQHLSLQESHSTGYPVGADEHNDERQYAETAAAALGSNHLYHSFDDSDVLSAVVDAIDHAEVPSVAMPSVLLELVFNRRLREQDKVVLCGHGADSLFGPSIVNHYQELRSVTRPVFAPLLKLLAGTLGRTARGNSVLPWERMYAFSRRRWDLNFDDSNHGLWLMGEVGDKHWVKETWGVDDEGLLDGRRRAVREFDLAHVLDAFTVLNFVSEVAAIQDVWGKLAAVRGRWIFYPFNSPELIRVANHTPWKEKMATHTRLIRRAGQMAGVPDFVLVRPTRTFGVSARQWAGPGGILESLFRVASPVVEPTLLRRFLTADERGAMTGWTLVSYAIWKRLLIDGEPPDRLRLALADGRPTEVGEPMDTGQSKGPAPTG